MIIQGVTLRCVTELSATFDVISLRILFVNLLYDRFSKKDDL